jgi:hypothetical protein
MSHPHRTSLTPLHACLLPHDGKSPPRLATYAHAARPSTARMALRTRGQPATTRLLSGARHRLVMSVELGCGRARVGQIRRATRCPPADARPALAAPRAAPDRDRSPRPRHRCCPVRQHVLQGGPEDRVGQALRAARRGNPQRPVVASAIDMPPAQRLPCRPVARPRARVTQVSAARTSSGRPSCRSERHHEGQLAGAVERPGVRPPCQRRSGLRATGAVSALDGAASPTRYDASAAIAASIAATMRVPRRWKPRSFMTSTSRSSFVRSSVSDLTQRTMARS